jgi:hypothetical protein
MMALVDQDSKILSGDFSTELMCHALGCKRGEPRLCKEEIPLLDPRLQAQPFVL